MSNIVPMSPALLAILSGSTTNIDVKPFTNEIHLLSIRVAGTSHIENIEELAPEITPGTRLSMLRHPDNEVDCCAIGIYLGEHHIGYVPMDDNEIIANLMDGGKTCICIVTDAEWRGNWFRIKADVRMVD